MPRNPEIKKCMVIGSGPIIIGQAAEFDYSGTQACLALKEDGIETVLVNSNPATIMTDSHIADRVYIEPITVECIEQIIAIERPDSVLPTLGGQTGLNIAMELYERGVFEKYNVKLLGARPETIKKAEDRGAFKETMESISQPLIPSVVVTDTPSALAFAEKVGYPVVVRPAYTLGGSGGGIVYNEEELQVTCDTALKLSRVGQTLIEKCISGWKEIEFEVMRDKLDNKIVVCSMENVDPVGIHTGDSVVVAPCQTLADQEFQMLRTASLNIVSALGIEGGCNVQLALHPDSFEYAVIEVNPRVSRSSALASKATGYPIAKVAAKIAVGYTLDEIMNAVTKKTVACFEPAIDYCVVKFPRFPFDKFVYAKKNLGTQMQATGEIMSIGTSFEQALMKAARSIEKKTDTMNLQIYSKLGKDVLIELIKGMDDDRLFEIYMAFKQGATVDEIHDITKIDKFFLYKLMNLLQMEYRLAEGGLDPETVDKALNLGYTYTAIERISGEKVERRPASYKTVDTCAAEFEAFTPYYYSTYDKDTEAVQSDKKKILVIGSGPIRIGQGIEFDYCTVHSVWALKEAGYEAIIANNNPETVSTDFDTSDRLYFDPLTPEDIDNVIAAEQPDGVIVQFGGQTAIKLAKHLHDTGVNILGTSFEMIDAAEDRELFDAMLEQCNIPRPKGSSVFTAVQAVQAANAIGYPVLLRPSYVLGGQNMIIAYNDNDVIEYMGIITRTGIDNPVLIDKYMMGKEIEVDAICDGEDILIPGIMEHIERAGIHSGDSISIYPCQNICDRDKEVIIEYTKRLAKALKAVGMINIQYILMDGQVYVIEVNPRSSRTVPYISKVTGIPSIKLATRCMLGEKLRNMGYGTGLYPNNGYVAVKVPVFSFEKLHNVDVHLGPEMKSTGEALGIARSFRDAIQKGLTAAGFSMKKSGKVLISVRNRDKDEILPIARRFAAMGFKIYATGGTRDFLANHHVEAEFVGKIHEGGSILQLIESGTVDYVISTSEGNRAPEADSVRIRRRAIECHVPCLTALDTARALCDSLENVHETHELEMINIATLNQRSAEEGTDCRSGLPMPSVVRGGKPMRFTKMHGIGNDYIYFDCTKEEISNPSQLALTLSDRHFGVGGDGIVLILSSKVADFRMRMFNSDGSEGKMCGNASRCVGKYVYERGLTHKTSVTLETLSGIKVLNLDVKNGKVESVTVDMGKAELHCDKIPVTADTETLIGGTLHVADKDWNITCVSMGNPHCVIFTEGIANMNLPEIGPKFEKHTIFPDRVNTEFVEVVNDHTLNMRVWERGTGETMACGTGACATVVAACENGYCQRGQEITVQLLGGNLKIKYLEDGTVLMTGRATFVFDGELL